MVVQNSKRTHAAAIFLACLTCCGGSKAVTAETAAGTGAVSVPAKEYVVIGEDRYDVPAPWAGNRLAVEVLVYEDFRPVPLQYTKDNTSIYVLKAIYDPLIELLDAAARQGVQLEISSGYRSAGYQKKIFLRMFAKGRSFEDAIRFVAPPGYSEHMLGTAVDFSPSNWRFAKTRDYQWLKDHAAAFGFLESYPQYGVPGFPWEAWHWRYDATEQTVDDQLTSPDP
ncbi:D-alanyl-D-alanine carboxypeptidase [Desulforhopalus singaporensis]|uniref:D-alanyl-D-alanine carboxypeptidase n=1 Tax=Desulforhopalus singaporensis TaxID=91360 RepID=A0A1H0N472_9BACT|nr:D-alanyl-D-alanine carboxypeptidase [Desulforhopalus singaporensis]